MFGGVGFLLNGNICVGVWKDFLIARVGATEYEELLAHPGVKEFDITGRAMRGWVMVAPPSTDDDSALRSWVDKATNFVRALPAKN